MKIVPPTDQLQRRWDHVTKSIAIIGTCHRAVHKGVAFHTVYSELIGAGDTGYLVFETGDRYVHLKGIVVAADGEKFLAEFLEDVTVEDGTLLTGHNRNRNSLNTPTMTVRHSPTSVSGGVLLDQFYMPGGYGTLPHAPTIGADVSDDLEWILKPNTVYVFALTNNGESDATVYIKVTWTETDEEA